MGRKQDGLTTTEAAPKSYGPQKCGRGGYRNLAKLKGSKKKKKNKERKKTLPSRAPAHSKKEGKNKDKELGQASNFNRRVRKLNSFSLIS